MPSPSKWNDRPFTVAAVMAVGALFGVFLAFQGGISLVAGIALAVSMAFLAVVNFRQGLASRRR